MTYHMEYDIQIGNFKVQTLKSVRVIKSVSQLSDTAYIELPGTLINETLQVEDKIHRGDPVTIQLGYKQAGLQTEFKGYLKAIKTDNTKIVLECEDELFLWDVPLKNEQLENISLQSLLHKVAQQVDSKYNVLCDYNFTYSKFTINNATGLDVLKKIQDETKANIFFDGQFLIITPVYSKGSWSGKTVKYDMTRNVISSDLKYIKASDKKIKVEIEYKGKDGKTYKASTGSEGGKTIKRTINAGDTSSLSSVAQNEYNLWCYDGYEGSLTGWLLPYCAPTDMVHLMDPTAQHQDGTYYVVGTEVNFSNGGGRRKVTIGRKM